MAERFASFDALLDDVLAQHRQGYKTDLEDLCNEYPEFADDIRELLPSILVMEGVKGVSPGPAKTKLKKIAGYRIISEIGHGGMGVVYEAEHDGLGRRVALKVLSNRLANSGEAAERFRREGRAIARLHHTNIVPLFEVGDEDGQLFLAMQLISGRSLYDVIRELRSDANRGVPGGQTDLLKPDSKLSSTSSLRIRALSSDSSLTGAVSDVGSGTHRNRHVRSIAQIGQQIAVALAYAHERGVIHRDIKPSNLLLDHNGVVWLTDFGLAKTDEDDLTQSGDFVGTLKYMAPERFHGDCDARSDVYAVGLTLYELLSTRAAFESSDRLKMIYLITTSEPLALRAINPTIPRDLETIVLKAMDKDPQRRYRTAQALADDLDCYLHDKPIKARRHSIRERFVRWSRRNRSLAVSIVATTVMAIVAIVVLAVSLRTARIATAEAKDFAAQALLTQADAAFDDQRFQSAVVLAAASLEAAPSEIAAAKLRSAFASVPATLTWTSPVFNDVSAIARSADGRYIAAASANEDTIWVWTADTMEVLCQLKGHAETVHSLTFHPDGDRLLSASKDQTVRFWDVASGECVWSQIVEGTPSSVAIDSKGRYAAAGGNFRGSVWVWDCESGNIQQRLLGDGSSITAVTFDRSTGRLSAGCDDGAIFSWSTSDWRKTTLRGQGRVNALANVGSGRIAVGTSVGLGIYDSNTNVIKTQAATAAGVETVCMSPSGTEIATGQRNGHIRFWHADTLQEKIR